MPKKGKKSKSVLPKALNAIDVVFVLDVTGSMQPYIEEAKRMVAEITKKIQDENKLDIRVALSVYRDHPPQDYSFVSKGHDFVPVDEFAKLLDQYDASGGGDIPEAVYDGLNEVFGFSWRKGADRAVYLIGDAPPHTDCPCQLTSKKLIARLKRRKIQVNAHSIANSTATTAAFKEFVDATEGTLTVGNRPEHTSGMYVGSLTTKSGEITGARSFFAGIADSGIAYSGAKGMTTDAVLTVANSIGMSEEEATATVSYLKKRGL